MTIEIVTGGAPVLYHGTRLSSAKKICRSGFKRAATASYTGHGVCLSESITIAYEYGSYEDAGCVLEVKFPSTVRWAEGNRGLGCDALFKAHSLDAIRTFSGNVWVLWNVGLMPSVRILSYEEAIIQMTQEFDENGPEVGYNAMIEDYATIWWGNEESSSHFQRFPEDALQLKDKLQRSTGRSTSSHLHAPIGAMA